MCVKLSYSRISPLFCVLFLTRIFEFGAKKNIKLSNDGKSVEKRIF